MTNDVPMPTLTLRLFGPFRAGRGGDALPGLHLREGERLLAYLALKEGEAVSTRELAERFWPHETRGGFLGQGDFPSLRQSLHALRKALGPEAHRLTRPHKAEVRLDLTGADVDVAAFDRVARDGGAGPEAWAAAVALYRGPLLEGWAEPWAAEARARRARGCERLLRRLAEAAEGEAGDAERWLRALLALCPSDERAGRDLMRRLGASGRWAEAFEAFEALREAAEAAGRVMEPETAEVAAGLRAAQASLPVGRTASARVGRAGDAPNSLEAESSGASGVPLPLADLEPAGGAVPIGSRFYVERPADAAFSEAVGRGDGVVLVKGARQAGKTSLLARALKTARVGGARVVLSDFQELNAAQLASPDALYLALASALAHQLDLDAPPRSVWDPDCGPNTNLALYLRRHALKAVPGRLVWALDEVDRLFGCAFGSEVFGLFRSWHNARALDPDGPWSRLTLAIAYATEAHLFIADPNQSPFNVGTRLALDDFAPEHAADLNRRYGAPLDEAAGEVGRFHALVGGQPYLTRRGLDALAGGMPLARLEREAADEGGPFGDHLRRLLTSLSQDAALVEATKRVLSGAPCPTPEAFYRLRAAGVLAGASPHHARPRCTLYAQFLAERLV